MQYLKSGGGIGVYVDGMFNLAADGLVLMIIGANDIRLLLDP